MLSPLPGAIGRIEIILIIGDVVGFQKLADGIPGRQPLLYGIGCHCKHAIPEFTSHLAMQAVECVKARTSHLYIYKVLRSFSSLEEGIHPVLGIINDHWPIFNVQCIIDQIGLQVFFNVGQAWELVDLVHNGIGIIQI